eukprot:12427004-Karenia_brevis.AAC.1
MAYAGALIAVFAGALWPGETLGSEDPKINKCPHCQQADYDEVHLCYTCPKLVTSRHPMIIKTQHLIEGASI